ncbi:LysR family transcriptional regulator [Pseudonocardia lacus]|uniref:LysR family transcriptional regulator n=1 Tax=Pseudonocardia lacus TaxID=2835865 RepID=UPI001BDD9F2C|nr:LysR family transcriptional regulator [Pseudonocardia lacus]
MENLQRLRVLRAVADHGSFTAAGSALSMTQPAVSQQVSALEREMGSRLVERSTRGARLTAAGEVVLRHALHILRSSDDARRDLDELRRGDLAPVRVAAYPTACTHLLPPAAAAWRSRRPGSPFAFTECDAARAVALLRQGAVDLALTYDYAAHPADLDHLRTHPLPDDPLRLVLPVGHPLATAPVADLTALAGEPWISGTAFACAESLRAICGVAGFTPRVALDSDRYPTTLALVAAGHGVALVPASALAGPRPGVVVRPVHPAPPPRRRWAVLAARPAPAVLDLLDCLVAAATP